VKEGESLQRFKGECEEARSEALMKGTSPIGYAHRAGDRFRAASITALNDRRLTAACREKAMGVRQ